MVAVAFLLIWGGYGTGLWGWCLIRDYNVTLGQLFDPVHPYSGAWPPATIPAGQTWPGTPAASSSSSGTAAAPSGTASPGGTATGSGVGSGLSGNLG